MHFSKIFTSFLITFLLIFSISYPCFAIDDSSYIWSTSTDDSILVNSDANSESPNAENNTNVTNENNSLNLECGSAILIEQKTGQILYSHNIHEQLRPASVTKVMSILLIMEAISNQKISLTDSVPCSENAASMGGSQIWLDPRETLSVDDMLKAICVNSANDCVVAMSEFIAGSEEAFVQMMNDKAKELGMNDTCFKNCHGLDEDGHVTSSYDISVMSRELLNKYPEVTKYTTIWMDSLRDGKSELVNTNKLVRNYAGCTGLKTGSTSLALYNLSASATRDGLSLIAVVMKAPTAAKRFSNATSLLDYGFSNFSYKTFAVQGDVVKSISVNKGVQNEVNAVYETSPALLIKKGEESNITYEINLNDSIQAPVDKGQILGTITYSMNGNVLLRTNLVAENSIEKSGFLNITKNIFSIWFNLSRN